MTVQDFMCASGVPMHLSGYELLKAALEISIEEPMKPIMAIHEEIAEKYGSKTYKVERNIRSAIEKGYPNLDAGIKEKLFKNKEKVATGEYVKAISYAIRNDLI